MGIWNSTFVKLRAKLKDTAPYETEKFGPNIFVVILSGTNNDFASNDAKDFQTAIRKKLNYPSWTIKESSSFSVPHRHDLSYWYCVNVEVRNANEEARYLCKYFKSSFLDQGVHLKTNTHWVSVRKIIFKVGVSPSRRSPKRNPEMHN